MRKLEYDTIPQTPSDMMNDDHREFVDNLNAIMKLVSQLNQEEAIDQELDKLLTHTKEHFAREEQLMLEGNFPPYPVHKAEHERVLKIIAETVNHWRLNRDRASLEPFLNDLLPEWFMQHVSTMDKVTADYLARNGAL